MQLFKLGRFPRTPNQKKNQQDSLLKMFQNCAAWLVE